MVTREPYELPELPRPAAPTTDWRTRTTRAVPREHALVGVVDHRDAAIAEERARAWCTTEFIGVERGGTANADQPCVVDGRKAGLGARLAGYAEDQEQGARHFGLPRATSQEDIDRDRFGRHRHPHERT